MRVRASRQPKTYIGLFIQATLLNQPEERRRLIKQLNNGQPGWNRDEPAVAEAAFELALKHMFPADVNVRNITLFVADLLTRLKGIGPLGQLEIEAVIRSGLGDPDVVVDNIPLSMMFNIHGAVTGKIVIDLKLKDSEINELVVAAEKLAFERGWKPPLIS
jgi:hypothetical protein